MNVSFFGEKALVLILEMVVAAIAVALILLSLKTLQAIRYLGVGKSFWMPVAVSGFLFFFGSVVAILFELGGYSLHPSLTDYTDEVVQISRLLALCILVGGIGNYSRRVTRNLGEQFHIPSRAVQADAEEYAEAEEEAEAPAAPLAPPATIAPPAPSIHERIIQDSVTAEPAQECKYRFGYLRALPKDASIPDECLSCDRIIECKHSKTKTVETRPRQLS